MVCKLSKLQVSTMSYDFTLIRLDGFTVQSCTDILIVCLVIIELQEQLSHLDEMKRWTIASLCQ
jgi:hypothetical protein